MSRYVNRFVTAETNVIVTSYFDNFTTNKSENLVVPMKSKFFYMLVLFYRCPFIFCYLLMMWVTFLKYLNTSHIPAT